MPVIGIDCGVTGAIAFIDDYGDASVYDLPIMANGKGSAKVKSKINPAELASLLLKFSGSTRFPVYIERISSMPGQGVATMFSMGDSLGCVRGVCGALGFPVEVITPNEWKKHFKLAKDKEVSRAKAIELWPNLPLSRKKDHNRSEALLIAEYGRLKTLNTI